MASACWFWAATRAAAAASAAATAAQRSAAATTWGWKSNGMLGKTTTLTTTASTTTFILLGASSFSISSSDWFLSLLPLVTTTKCEEEEATKAINDNSAATTSTTTKRSVNLKPRMTAMGRFAYLTETPDNPSVPTFVVALVGAPLTPQDFQRVWQRRNMDQRHERFQQRLTVTTNDDGNNAAAPSSYVQFHPTLQPVSHHVTETLFPLMYRTELKDRLHSILTQPFPVYDKLWKVQVSTGGAVGQSGIIPRRQVVAQTIKKEEQQPKNLSNNHNVNEVRPTESLIVFSAHHALADGVSLSAAFTDLCDEGPAIEEMILQEWNKRKNSHTTRRSFWKRLLRRLQALFGFFVGCVQALAYQCQLFLVSPRSSPLEQLVLLHDGAASTTNNGSGDRTLSWCQVATVDEMKRVARLLGNNITVNDLLVSCVSAAIAKLLQHHRQHLAIRNETQFKEAENDELSQHRRRRRHHNSHNKKDTVKSINVVIPVHLQGGVLLPGQSLGNKIGAMAVRIPCEVDYHHHHHQHHDTGDDDLHHQPSVQRLQHVHSTLQTHVKQNPAGVILSSWMARTLASPPLAAMLPISWIRAMFTSTQVGATCVITNVRGPADELHFEGRRVVAAQPFLPLPPGIPIGVALFSYAGVMNMSVNAQAWAVPNADQFLLWVVEEYQRLADLSVNNSTITTTTSNKP